MELFRHCPGCGRRFHIKLESKKLVDLERASRPTHEGQLLPGGSGYGARIGIDVYEGRPIIIDVNDSSTRTSVHIVDTNGPRSILRNTGNVDNRIEITNGTNSGHGPSKLRLT